MVKLVELECPNCGGRVKRVDEKTAKCPHCETGFLIDSGVQEKVVHVYETRTPQKKIGIEAIIFLVCILCAIGLIIVLVQREPSENAASSFSDMVSDYQTENESAHQGMLSEFYQQLVYMIYGKSFGDITQKELQELTYLEIDRDGAYFIVEYRRLDGEVQQLTLPSGLFKDDEDLGKFKGLKSLKIEDSIPEEALSELKQLTELWSYNDFAELTNGLPNPDKITALYVRRVTDLNGLEAFPNLEELEIYAYGMTDIDKLAEVKNLKSLVIVSGDQITDWNVLHVLTKLEKLYIESETVKDISFIEKMDSLQELGLTDTKLLSVAYLKDRTDIKKLVLEDNYNITDYSALSSLSGLEELVLELKYGERMPDASAWTNMRKLKISGTSDAFFLAYMPELEYLSMACIDCDTLGALDNLQKLETLEIGDVEGDFDKLSVLGSLASLKKLDISLMTAYGNVDGFFQIPSLEELNINDCSFGLNPDTIPVNTNLKILCMSRVKFWENIYVQYDGMFTMVDYDDINLSEKMDFLSKFPNLEEVYLQGNKLSDVTFAENLPKLRVIDITNNYVTDLRPLSTLEELETVLCGSNPISQGLDLGEGVWVNMDSVTEEKPFWK